MRQLIEYTKQFGFDGPNYFQASDNLPEYFRNTERLYIQALTAGDQIKQDKYLNILGKIVACLESAGYTIDQIVEYLKQ